jgi:hypothetical protein
MIPKTNSTEYQNEVLEKVRDVYESEAEITDRMLLMSIFENFRTGGGLRLSKFGFDICNGKELYEFVKVPLKREDRNSVVYTSMDRICTSPYYVNGYDIYISDMMVVTQLTFCCDDFQKLFAVYM